MTDDQPERDLTSLSIAERIDMISTAKARVTEDKFGLFNEDLKHPHRCICMSMSTQLGVISGRTSFPRYCYGVTAAAGQYCADVCAKECP